MNVRIVGMWCRRVCVGAGIVAVFLLCMVPAFGRDPFVTLPEGSSLKIEHLGFSYSGFFYLDGPRLEAACPNARSGAGASDADGNVWFGHGKTSFVGSIGGRCIDMKTGMLRAYFGDDYWTGFTDADEGPACAFPTLPMKNGGLGMLTDTYFVYGAPMQGGEKGYILFADSDANRVTKVFKNPEQNDEWWFKVIVGGGKAPLPHAKGGTVGAREAKVDVNMVQVTADGRPIVFADGGFYELKDGNLVCLLGHDDYKEDPVLPRMNKKGKYDEPRLGVLGGDGTFYLGTYFGLGYAGAYPSIWRIVPGGKLEAYAWARGKYEGRTKDGKKYYDGPAMNADAHCGHHFWAQCHNYAYIPGDIMLPAAHDEPILRRIRNGRVSSLCSDGEWRECVEMPKDASWFWVCCSPGPNGTATGENVNVSKNIPYIVSGIDYTKETVGPPIDVPVRMWPPNGKDDSKKGGK